jgi:hypothetical protein
MILRLLTLLFDQRIRLSSTTVKEKLRPEFVDKSLTTVVGVYAISLVSFTQLEDGHALILYVNSTACRWCR